jgi:hypothetical protein
MERITTLNTGDAAAQPEVEISVNAEEQDA